MVMVMLLKAVAGVDAQDSAQRQYGSNCADR